MHELSIARAVVASVEKHADGRPVEVVNLRVGALRQVVPDSLAFYFGFVTDGTVCEGARLEIEVVPAALRCDACGAEWELEEPVFRCGACGSAEVEVVAGEELRVESIEIREEEEVACIAPQ
jgi:hydrogenase nickel incorporation protein HypA/HybF